jgi:hypothetical protein
MDRTDVPAVSYDKKLSNWIQYCRTAYRRGAIGREIADALIALGIRLERGPTDVHSTKAAAYGRPRGMIPVLKAAHERVQTLSRVPSLRSDALTERHAASWLVRLQAGLLPANSVGWIASIDDQLLPAQLLVAVRKIQSDREMIAEWLLWCARVQAAFDRRAPGNKWHETVYLVSPALIEARYPDLAGMAGDARNGHPVVTLNIPERAEIANLLNIHLTAGLAVKHVRFYKNSPYGAPMLAALKRLRARVRARRQNRSFQAPLGGAPPRNPGGRPCPSAIRVGYER